MEEKKEIKKERPTWISRKSSARTEGPLSIAFPDPLKTLPSMSSETAMRRMSPVNSHVVCLASIPDVPSNTYKNRCRRRRRRRGEYEEEKS